MRTITPIDDQQALGEALRSARKARGLNQQDLADAVGVHRRVIIDLEAGDGSRSPLMETVQKVAGGLGFKLALIPVEAVNYALRYKPSADAGEAVKEIDDDGIPFDVERND